MKRVISWASIFVLATVTWAWGNVSPHPGFLWQSAEPFAEYDVAIYSTGESIKIVDSDRIANVSRYVPSAPLPPGEYRFTVTRANAPVAEQKFVIAKPEIEIVVKSGSDMTEIRAALNKAKAATSSRVQFEPGEYLLQPGNEGTLFEIADTTNLIIDGGGAKFIIADIARVASINNSRHITLRNFEIDYSFPAYTAARVESIDETGSMQLRLLDGYSPPETVARFMEEQRGLFYDAQNPRMAEEVPLLVYMLGPWEKLEESIYRLTAKNPRDVRNVKPGMIYVSAPRYVPQGVEIQHSEDITLVDITAYYLPGIGVSTVFAEDLKLIRLNFLRRKERLLAVQNGGTNLHNARIGPWVEGCRFENTGDDCNHINALVMTAIRQPGPNRIDIDNSLPGVKLKTKDLQLKVGDRLAFFDRPSGSLLAEARVAIVTPAGQTTEVTLDRDIPTITLGDGKNFPPLNAAQIYNLDAAAGNFVFRGNVFLRGRRTGILAKSGPGLIENNRFEELGGGGVEIFNAPYEGLHGHEILIRKNVFRRGGLVHKNSGAAGALWIVVFLGDPPERLHREVRFLDNEVIDYPGTALQIADVKGVQIEGNHFTNDELSKLREPKAKMIRLRNVTNGVIAQNRLEDKRYHPSAHIEIQDSENVTTDSGIQD